MIFFTYSILDRTWPWFIITQNITTNSTTQTRGANKQNEITTVSGATTPTYDNNGNLTKDENNYRFIYDAWNRQVILKNASDAVITTNSFNGINENIKVVAGSSTIDRIFSTGWQDLEDKSGSNTVTRNVWSSAYVDALVLRDKDTDGNGTLDERLFPTQDANYNVTAIFNTSGTVQERYTYTPFGVVTYRDSSGSAIGSSTNAWVFLHQGGQINIVGDYDFRNRVLSPTLGRWLTNDPLGFTAGDVNTYRYVGNGPILNLDPLGLQDPKGNPNPFRSLLDPGNDLNNELSKIEEKIKEITPKPTYFYIGLFLPPLQLNNEVIPGSTVIGWIAPGGSGNNLISIGNNPDLTQTDPSKKVRPPIIGGHFPGITIPIGEAEKRITLDMDVQANLGDLSNPKFKFSTGVTTPIAEFKPSIIIDPKEKPKIQFDFKFQIIPLILKINEPVNKGDQIIGIYFDSSVFRKKGK